MQSSSFISLPAENQMYDYIIVSTPQSPLISPRICFKSYCCRPSSLTSRPRARDRKNDIPFQVLRHQAPPLTEICRQISVATLPMFSSLAKHIIRFELPFSGLSFDPWTTQLCPRVSKWLHEAGLSASQVKGLEMTVLGARKGKMIWEIDVQEVSVEFRVVEKFAWPMADSNAQYKAAEHAKQEAKETLALLLGGVGKYRRVLGLKGIETVLSVLWEVFERKYRMYQEL